MTLFVVTASAVSVVSVSVVAASAVFVWPVSVSPVIAVSCAVLCAAAAGALLPAGRPRAVRRLSRMLPARGPAAGRAGRGSVSGDGRAHQDPRTARGLRGRLGLAILAGVASGLVIGGIPGLLAGAVVAVGCARVLARMEPAERRRRAARLHADLPVALDLLAACLSGGVPWGDAVDAVATAIGGPLGAELRGVAAQVRLGADPAVAWLALARDPVLAPLARTAARATHSGTALAPSLARLARDQRRSAHAAAAARARAAGVRAVAPLGLCFLPAFVLLGIVPAIAGIASTLPLPW
jgi:Flp pilus assembly protein TadB